MNATNIKNCYVCNIKPSHRKDGKLHKSYKAVSFDSEELVELVDLRIYYPSSVAYACIWIKSQDSEWQSGSGSAGGYGYHKESAAVSEAIQQAGYKLSESIDARGDAAIESAVMAIAKTLTKNKVFIVDAYA